MEVTFGIEMGETVHIVFSEISDKSNVRVSTQRRVFAINPLCTRIEVEADGASSPIHNRIMSLEPR
jgi:hypothetical protein